MTHRIRFFLLISASVFLASSLIGQDTEATRLFSEIERRSNAIKYESGQVRMSIFDARGRARVREIDSWSYNEGNVSKVLVRFQSPADVRGTALLTLQEGNQDSQKLYLPAIGRIQTIGAAQLSDRFMGSDFLFDDFRPVDFSDFKFQVLSKSSDKWTVRGTPASERTFAYAEYVVDPVRYVMMEAIYYNAAGMATRKLTVTDFHEVMSGIWRGNLLDMRDLLTNRRTELQWKNRVFDKTIPASTFTERELTRF